MSSLDTIENLESGNYLLSAGFRCYEASKVLPMPGSPIGMITTTEVAVWLECFNEDSFLT